MRAQEFINESINPDILDPQFNHEVEIGDYLCRASTIGGDKPQLYIQCYRWAPRAQEYRRVGYAKFAINDDELISDVTQVLTKHQSKGVASTMYAYAKMLGNDIAASPEQTDQGKAMWDAWHKSGEAQHLTRSDSTN